MKKRDAAQTQALILDTATKEFAKHGYDGLRVDELALKAGVNKATIYYHFKDKKFIYEKILLDMSKVFFENLSQELKEITNPKEKIEAFMDAMIYGVSTKRDTSKIMMQELAVNSKNLTDDTKKEFFKIIDIFVAIVQEGIKEKIFKDVDPHLIHSIALGSLNYHCAIKDALLQESNDDFRVAVRDDGEQSIKEMILNHILI